MDVARLLDRLAAHPAVRDADAAIAPAVAELRWHPALWRRWREARAEAALRSARASAELDGARLDGEWRARLLSPRPGGRAGEAGDGVGGPGASRPGGRAGEEADGVGGDPADELARGVWRAQVHLTSLMPDLAGRGRPVVPAAAQLLAGLHRDLLGAGAVPGPAVGRPRDGAAADAPAGLPVVPAEEVPGRLEVILAVVDAEGTSGLVRTAVAHAELALVRPFLTGNGTLARAVARHLAVRSGLEPTGVALPDEAAAHDPRGYTDALTGYATGEPDAVVAWIVAEAGRLRRGAELGQDVAGAVLAGTLG